MKLNTIEAVVASELENLAHLTNEQIFSEALLVQQLSNHLIKSGGKRLRPLLLLLTAKALGYNGNHHITLAAVLEFIHTATLLHDDVVDNSTMRRGQKSANSLWDNRASILVGDFLYSRSFQMMVSAGDMEVMAILSNTTNAIAEGEVLQLANSNNFNTKELQYFQIIEKKTAMLFAAAAEIAAVISGRNDLRKPLFQFGLNLGIAFQLIDDVLDFAGNENEIGKKLGDDLREGKITLPLICAFNACNDNQDKLSALSDALNNSDFEFVMHKINEANGIGYSRKLAQEKIKIAVEQITVLPQNQFATSLQNLAEFAISRSF